MEEKILKIVKLNSNHNRTGNTTHFKGGEIVSMPFCMKIVQYDDDTGVNLIHYDEDGGELTDTYHESINEAMQQANFEFNIEEGDWENSSQTNTEELK